jgi:diacylglycerol O-acyltransferase / wax synthase
MARMTAMEAAFLAIERADEPRHIGVVMILDPGEDGPLSVEATRALVRERLPRMPTARRIPTSPSLGLTRPSWRHVSEVDLDDHVRHVTLAPGTDVADVVADLHEGRLPRDRPLWQLHLIDGLPHERVALYAKVHLSALDDTTGIDLLTALLDDDEDGRPAIEVSALVDGDDSPGLYDRLVDPVPDQLRHAAGFPLRLARRASKSVGDQLPGLRLMASEFASRTPGLGGLAPVLGIGAGVPDGDEHPTGRAPRLSFNAPIGPKRAFAIDELETIDILAVKEGAGCSFNEVVIAACAGGVRRWLLANDELPSSPVVAIVPVLVTRAGDSSAGRHIAGMVLPLPTNVADPRQRLDRTVEALAAAKRRHIGVPASLHQDVAMFAPPLVASWATGLLDAMPHRPFISPTINLAITNVPGPRRPVSLAGRRLHASHPVLSVTDLTPLHLGVQTGPQRVGLGAIACRDHVHDLSSLVHAVGLELAELHAAVTPSRRRAMP